MDNNWFVALVIILSVMLAFLLFVAIMLVYKFLQIARQIKKVTDYAENTVEKAEEAADFFRSTATPIAIAKLIANFSDKFAETASKIKSKKGKK